MVRKSISPSTMYLFNYFLVEQVDRIHYLISPACIKRIKRWPTFNSPLIPKSNQGIVFSGLQESHPVAPLHLFELIGQASRTVMHAIDGVFPIGECKLEDACIDRMNHSRRQSLDNLLRIECIGVSDRSTGLPMQRCLQDLHRKFYRLV